MATRFIFLPGQAESPTTAQLTVVNGRPVLAFDAATDEYAYWTAIAPQNLSGTITVVIYYFMASAVSGAVYVQTALEAITSGDALDLDASTSFGADNTVGDSVPATAGYMSGQLLTVSNADSIMPGDLFRLRFNRDADNAGDNASGDMYVLAIEFRDSA
jgi:hypothetical protein